MHASLFAIFDSPFDLGAVLVVVLLLFGSSKLPKLARSLGSAQREFRKGVDEGDTEPTPGTSAVPPLGQPLQDGRSDRHT